MCEEWSSEIECHRISELLTLKFQFSLLAACAWSANKELDSRLSGSPDSETGADESEIFHRKCF